MMIKLFSESTFQGNSRAIRKELVLTSTTKIYGLRYLHTIFWQLCTHQKQVGSINTCANLLCKRFLRRSIDREVPRSFREASKVPRVQLCAIVWSWQPCLVFLQPSRPLCENSSCRRQRKPGALSTCVLTLEKP